MEIINLCPHTINFYINNYKTIRIPQGNKVARAVFESEYLTTFDGIPIHMRKVKQLQGLPKLKKNAIYIVSSIFQQSIDDDLADTYHIYSPDTISDAWMSEGNVLKVSKLAKFQR